jgi:hypothetical protein
MRATVVVVVCSVYWVETLGLSIDRMKMLLPLA